MSSIHPWSTRQDIRLAVNALRAWLFEAEREPIDPYRLAVAWQDFRGCFGEPGTAPEGISVDGHGVPDVPGVRTLIQLSSNVSQQVKDDLLTLLDAYQPVLNALAKKKSTGRYDSKPIREFRKQLHSVIEVLAELSPASAAETFECVPADRGFGRSELNTEEPYRRTLIAARQFKAYYQPILDKCYAFDWFQQQPVGSLETSLKRLQKQLAKPEWKADVESQLKQLTDQRKVHQYGLAVKLLEALMHNDTGRVQEYVTTIKGTGKKSGDGKPLVVINHLLKLFADRAASRQYETLLDEAKVLGLDREGLNYCAVDAIERGKEEDARLLSSCVNILDMCSGRLISELNPVEQLPKLPPNTQVLPIHNIEWAKVQSFNNFIQHLDKVLDEHQWYTETCNHKVNGQNVSIAYLAAQEAKLIRDVWKTAFRLMPGVPGNNNPLPDEPSEFALEALVDIRNWAVRAMAQSVAKDYDANPKLPTDQQSIEEASEEKPSWDKNLRELRYRGTVIKKYIRPAKNQHLILDEFQRLDWCTNIVAPTKLYGKALGDAIDDLKKQVEGHGITFGRNGTGTGITWNICQLKSNKESKIETKLRRKSQKIAPASRLRR